MTPNVYYKYSSFQGYMNEIEFNLYQKIQPKNLGQFKKKSIFYLGKAINKYW